MDLRQLECFLAVADHGGFTAAAERLHVTQPAVSGQVRKLERELGETLFHRAGRGVTLTAAGRATLAPARAALAAADRVRSSVSDLTGLLTGRVSLGHVSSGAPGTLLEPLTRFHAAHPGVEVSLVEHDSSRLLEQVLAGELDLAWVGTTGDLPAGVEHRTVLDERLVLAVPAGHELVDRSAVSFDDAARRPLVAMPRGTGSRAAFDEGCRERSLDPPVAMECSSPDLIGALVRSGVGVAVLPEPLAAHLGLTAVPLVHPAARSRVVLAWRRGGPTTPAARAFLGFVGTSPVSAA